MEINTNFVEVLAEFLKKTGEKNRLKILLSIEQGAKSVSEIIAETELSQPLVSFHLKVLREANIIESQREGTFVYYSLVNPDLIEHIMILAEHLDYFELED
ncbi:metalloregulator ArsR/SmtB family transcription factor [Natroniella acetigena]|uniref:ArsR/SmtB family transcription factor n=1 Tax=Natroniella acetigena TaxID=52004 RepID=UPI00200B5832|nr:metalloregulator ArsR/SmtB family transcription factor [Natroniella acetigena]MCK8827235.1 metalloregulator ArsR/SmtB family transcription factor [Natroniella acetigena]